MKFNLNDEVLIRITPRGEEVWHEHWVDAIRNNRPIPHIKRDEQGRTNMQLWWVMEMFGQDVGMCKTPPIEMTIETVEKPSRPESCKTCRFFEINGENIGACRRYPPVVVNLRMQKPKVAEVFDATEFPVVHVENWCGEYVEEDGQ